MRVKAHAQLSAARRHTTELCAVLLAGVGIGVGLGALVIGRDGHQRHRPSFTSTPHSASARKLLAPATAGVQPGRGSIYRSRVEVTAPESASPVLDANAHASFAQLEASLSSHLELAVAPLGMGAPETLGGDAPALGWSTTKVPVLVALLKARGETLTAEEQSWATSAITESDNQSVLDLFHDLESIEGGLTQASTYMQDLLRASGDEETAVATAPPPPGAVTTFGQTEWKPSNAVKFFSALARGCLLSPAGTDYALGLMQRIEPSESWGLGDVGFPHVAFKGGWGPELDGAYLVRQSGIVDVGSARAVAVAIVAFPPAGPASFEAGTTMLTEGARWLRQHLRLVPRPATRCE